MKGQGQYNITLIDELEKIRVRQGLTKAGAGTGSIVGMITAKVDDSATQMIFGGATTAIDPPFGGSDSWTIADLDSYTFIITLNGTGILNPAIDYNLSGLTTIRLVSPTTFITDEIYTIMLFSK